MGRKQYRAGIVDRQRRLQGTAPLGVSESDTRPYFHFRLNRQWDADPVLSGLSGSVRELVEGGLVPDLVALTGDIAFAGRADEYRQAREWLDGELLGALPDGFDRSRILIVAGNHDVDRKAINFLSKSTQDALLAAKNQQQIAAVLSDPTQRDILLARHAARDALTASRVEQEIRTHGEDD